MLTTDIPFLSPESKALQRESAAGLAAEDTLWNTKPGLPG
jgi:hypothetical protein